MTPAEFMAKFPEQRTINENCLQDMACPECGSIEEIRKHHLCVECRRPVAIQQLLADDAGEEEYVTEPALSSVVSSIERGRPLMRSRPRTSAVSSSANGHAEPIWILISSAVRSPMAMTLNQH